MKQERQLGQAAWIGACDHQCEVFWDSWDRMEQLEIVFVPLLVPVVVRESLLSSWPCQELFFKADAAKGAAQCFAGNGISGVLPALPGVRASLGPGLESPFCGYGVYKQERSRSKVETCILHR